MDSAESDVNVTDLMRPKWDIMKTIAKDVKGQGQKRKCEAKECN